MFPKDKCWMFAFQILSLDCILLPGSIYIHTKRIDTNSSSIILLSFFTSPSHLIHSTSLTFIRL